MNLFENVAQLANLHYDNNVSIQESYDLQREALQSLIDAGLCPREELLFEMYPEIEGMDLHFWQQENRSRQLIFPQGISIIDRLGEYRSSSRQILIFTKMCKITAISLGISIKLLKKVVEAHEVAHAVTHLGKDNGGRIWDHFDIATSDDKELFAQIYPFSHFNISGDNRAAKCFVKLSEHQDSRYNSWRGYKNTSLSQINRDLLLARMNIPGPPIFRPGTQSDDDANERIPVFDTTNDEKSGRTTVVDTIVVPAEEEGFRDVFLAENRWYTISLDIGMTQPGKIKYIAVYRKTPIAAVTHWAFVKDILPWGNTGKFVVNFAEPAWEIRPINLLKGGKVKAPQSRRYTSFAKLQKAQTMDDLF